MFTGIIETVGRVIETRTRDDTREIRIRTPEGFLHDVEPGASIAVDGACLTPVHVDATEFQVDAVGTTLSRTIVGSYREGTHVNLERALMLGERLDGHLVQGHVDGVGNLESIRESGRFRLLEVSIPAAVHAGTILHGSIALNGVSLTVNRLNPGGHIEVAIIPHTWSATSLRYLSEGDPVNVEGDLIGKYVGRLLRGSSGSGPRDEPAEEGKEE